MKGEKPGKIRALVLSLAVIIILVQVPERICAFDTAFGSQIPVYTGQHVEGIGAMLASPPEDNRPLINRPLIPFMHRSSMHRWNVGQSGPFRSFSSAAYLLDDGSARLDTVPNPSSVMRRSMIIPGWGQVVNRQVWKVPIIYGMLAGLTYYSILMDQNYRDYRAAFYNRQNPDGDQRFGPTPPHIDPNQNPESLRYNRNVYRNRRDLTIIGVVLAYGLNIVDAYVFAQMRDFDVSDDLSARFHLGPPPFQNMGEYGSNSHGSFLFRLADPHAMVLTFQLTFR
jgi:hypothetical protein